MLHFAIAAALVPASATAQPACAVNLIGTWQLVSIANWGPDGKRNDAPFGKDPMGMFIFSADGHTSVIISYGNRKKLGSGDRLAGSVQQKAEAFDSSFGYSGRYTCLGDRVVVRVTHSSVPDWVGTDMVRIVKAGGREAVHIHTAVRRRWDLKRLGACLGAAQIASTFHPKQTLAA